MSMLDDVITFHRKYGIEEQDSFVPLTADVSKYRLDFLEEELTETRKALQVGNNTEAIDGLLDLIYVALGTLDLMGLSRGQIQAHWNEIQKANMSKERSLGKDDKRSKRKHSLDIVKPVGWKPPNHNSVFIKAHKYTNSRKNKLIILEGCDATGKSTLSNQIFELAPGANVIHNGRFNSRYEAMRDYTFQVSSNNESPLILDRSYISEFIYGKVKRNHGVKHGDIESVRKLELLMFDNFIPLVIVCAPPLELVLSQWRARVDQEYLKEEKEIEDIYYEYCNIKQYTNIPYVFYDYTKLNHLEELKELIL